MANRPPSHLCHLGRALRVAKTIIQSNQGQLCATPPRTIKSSRQRQFGQAKKRVTLLRRGITFMLNIARIDGKKYSGIDKQYLPK